MGIYIVQEEGKLGSWFVVFFLVGFVFVFLGSFLVCFVCFVGFLFFFTESICLHPCVDGDLGAVTGSAFSGFKLIWTSP